MRSTTALTALFAVLAAAVPHDQVPRQLSQIGDMEQDGLDAAVCAVGVPLCCAVENGRLDCIAPTLNVTLPVNGTNVTTLVNSTELGNLTAPANITLPTNITDTLEDVGDEAGDVVNEVANAVNDKISRDLRDNLAEQIKNTADTFVKLQSACLMTGGRLARCCLRNAAGEATLCGGIISSL